MQQPRTINAPVQPSGAQIAVPLQPVSTGIHSTPSMVTPPPAKN